MSSPFPIGESVQFGWKHIQKSFIFLVGITLAICAIHAFFTILTEIADDKNGFLYVLTEFASFAVSCLLSMGMITISLKFVDGRDPELMDLFANLERLAAYIGASILCFALIAVGLVLLIIPGIYIGIRLFFYPYAIVDEGRGPLDALQRSWDLTRGHALELFLFGLLLVGINVLGMMLLGVGLLVTLPISWLAGAYVFRFLQGTPAMAEAVSPTPPATG